MQPGRALQACALIALACCSHAYYLPGTYPQEFTMGQNLQGEVSEDACVKYVHRRHKNDLTPLQMLISTSDELGSKVKAPRLSSQIDAPTAELMCYDPAAEVNSVVSSETELPYNYYSLPFCKPAEGVRKSINSINPGTILMGSRIENSPYNFSMLVSFTAVASAQSSHACNV